MEKIVEVISDTSGELYEVSLKNENGILSFNCSCPSGMTKGICKHRKNLLDGDVSNLVNESDVFEIQVFLSSIEKSKIDNFFSELDKIEKQFDKEIRKLKKQKSDAKREFSKRFCDGF